ncbi:sensor histidine kinase [Thalassotalea castellviae]|uniref:histidine kinase n=1 Tax=Thalassotalea castellviae TaxID=3075612 RepID=A0ABU3A080_9GAMM|nr:ATP-binding protein [Thalassotalea sp. W431]MDT0602371.1 ATP-binding protein [Thalassotalea sp. W431]
MGFKRFSLMIITRTLLVILTALLFAYFMYSPGYHAASFVTLLIIGFQFHEMIRFITKTNAELTRFLNAARYADFSQRFELAELGMGFDELGKAFTEILNRLQLARVEQEKDLKYFKAVIEQVPVPLLTVHHNKNITLWNNAARRLFGSNHVTKLSDLQQFSQDFEQTLANINHSGNLLIDIMIDGMEHRLSVSATQITVNQQQEILISMQDIQNELNIAQLQAWQDLVSVLTHEIMNSITPIASLTKTAADLVEDVRKNYHHNQAALEDLSDVADAVKTVANRSDGLMSFVSSYRKLTRLPTPNKKRIKIEPFLSDISNVMSQTGFCHDITMSILVEPTTLEFEVDVAMMEQVFINLLKNAQQALINKTKPIINIHAKLNKRGRVMIAIADNGNGVAKEIIEQIFVPFFTTKREGSGVGLALTRQIMIAHGGHIKVENTNEGACFTLTF